MAVINDIDGYWIKEFISIHDRLANQSELKRPRKRPPHKNYWPITCLPVIWKILTEKIRELIYDSLISRRLFSKEQKGCC